MQVIIDNLVTMVLGAYSLVVMVTLAYQIRSKGKVTDFRGAFTAHLDQLVVAFLLAIIFLPLSTLASTLAKHAEVGVSLILLLIGAIPLTWISVKLFLCVPAAVIGEKGIRESLADSWHTTSGNWYRIFDNLLLLGILVVALVIIIFVTLGVLTGGVTTLPLIIALVFSIPGAIGSALGAYLQAEFYFSLKEEKAKVLEVVYQNKKPLNVAEIARHTDIPLPWVRNCLRQLSKEKKLESIQVNGKTYWNSNLANLEKLKENEKFS
jgi:hypothetical protein